MSRYHRRQAGRDAYNHQRWLRKQPVGYQLFWFVVPWIFVLSGMAALAFAVGLGGPIMNAFLIACALGGGCWYLVRTISW